MRHPGQRPPTYGRILVSSQRTVSEDQIARDHQAAVDHRDQGGSFRKLDTAYLDGFFITPTPRSEMYSRFLSPL